MRVFCDQFEPFVFVRNRSRREQRDAVVRGGSGPAGPERRPDHQAEHRCRQEDHQSDHQGQEETDPAHTAVVRASVEGRVELEFE